MIICRCLNCSKRHALPENRGATPPHQKRCECRGRLEVMKELLPIDYTDQEIPEGVTVENGKLHVWANPFGRQFLMDYQTKTFKFFAA